MPKAKAKAKTSETLSHCIFRSIRTSFRNRIVSWICIKCFIPHDGDYFRKCEIKDENAVPVCNTHVTELSTDFCYSYGQVGKCNRCETLYEAPVLAYCEKTDSSTAICNNIKKCMYKCSHLYNRVVYEIKTHFGECSLLEGTLTCEFCEKTYTNDFIKKARSTKVPIFCRMRNEEYGLATYKLFNTKRGLKFASSKRENEVISIKKEIIEVFSDEDLEPDNQR